MRDVLVSAWMVGLVVVTAACGSGTRSVPSPTPTDPLTALRVRGTLIVSIRMTAPPAPREPGDAAHEQKRAFEAALATALAQRVLGPGARAELRNTGRDRTGPLLTRDADIAMTVAGPAIAGISFSQPYAAGGIDLVTSAGTTLRVEDLAGKTIGTTPGEADSAELAQAFFTQRGVQVKLQSFVGLRPAADALASGQVAAVAADRAGVAVLNRERANSLRALAELAPRPFAVGVRNDAAALLAKVNEALAALSASGEIRKLADAAGFPYEAP